MKIVIVRIENPNGDLIASEGGIGDDGYRSMGVVERKAWDTVFESQVSDWVLDILHKDEVLYNNLVESMSKNGWDMRINWVEVDR